MSPGSLIHIKPSSLKLSRVWTTNSTCGSSHRPQIGSRGNFSGMRPVEVISCGGRGTLARGLGASDYTWVRTRPGHQRQVRCALNTSSVVWSVNRKDSKRSRFTKRMLFCKYVPRKHLNPETNIYAMKIQQIFAPLTSLWDLSASSYATSETLIKSKF